MHKNLGPDYFITFHSYTLTIYTYHIYFAWPTHSSLSSFPGIWPTACVVPQSYIAGAIVLVLTQGPQLADWFIWLILPISFTRCQYASSSLRFNIDLGYIVTRERPVLDWLICEPVCCCRLFFFWFICPRTYTRWLCYASSSFCCIGGPWQLHLSTLYRHNQRRKVWFLSLVAVPRLVGSVHREPITKSVVAIIQTTPNAIGRTGV